MAIDLSGQDKLPVAGFVPVEVSPSHPLLALAQILPWEKMCSLVVEDLKKTPKGCWWSGRKICVRIHLGAYLLQSHYNYTDRKLEYHLKDNAAHQLFCGRGIVDTWHAPDHTKIEDFRNRLSEETHRSLANLHTQAAVSLGFADPRELDIDSTVQEANIAYPSDAHLLRKLGAYAKKFVTFIKEKMNLKGAENIDVNMDAIGKVAREYFFLGKNKATEIKAKAFQTLYNLVDQEIASVMKLCQNLTPSKIKKIPWTMKQAFDVLRNKAWDYLCDVRYFIETQTIEKQKLLSFHAKELACITKGKLGKRFEFGRVFQLGRIKGNFMFVLNSTSVRMDDKQSFIPMIENHQSLFGKDVLKTVAADKGYWSKANKEALIQRGLTAVGLAKPGIQEEESQDLDLKEHLHNRRAGIEPLIGHMKHGGQLGKSRMKSDAATLAAGYRSVLGLNSRQLLRNQQRKLKNAA